MTVSWMGSRILRKALYEMTMHASECPYNHEIEVARRAGRVWRYEGCTAMSEVPAHQATLRACRLCIERIPPPDRVDHVFGGTLRQEMEDWMESAGHFRPE